MTRFKKHGSLFILSVIALMNSSYALTLVKGDVPLVGTIRLKLIVPDVCSVDGFEVFDGGTKTLIKSSSTFHLELSGLHATCNESEQPQITLSSLHGGNSQFLLTPADKTEVGSIKYTAELGTTEIVPNTPIPLSSVTQNLIFNAILDSDMVTGEYDDIITATLTLS